MRNSLTAHAALLVAATVNCGIDKEPDMALPKQSITWPIQGGLDTKRAPLSMAPGSNLLVQDVRQERLGEWRRRDGFSQADGDTLPELAPYFVGTLGDSGLFENGQSGLSAYSPSVTPKWGAQTLVAPPQHRTRKPIYQDDGSNLGFCRAGNMVAIVSTSAVGGQKITVFDTTSGAVLSTTVIANAGVVRAAATATKLVLFVVGAGNLNAYTVDAVTGVVSGPVLIKGAQAIAPPIIDARWYGGATITVISRNLANALAFFEFNPSTGAVVVDTTVAGVTITSSLALLADPDASGVRFVASSASTPTTRVTRCDSTGAVLTNDQAEAVESTQITGVASVAGASWNVIYKTVAQALRTQNKTGGVVGAAANFQGSATWGGAAGSGEIAAQAWRDTSINAWFFLLGVHSINAADPQDTYVEMMMPMGASVANAIPVSTPVPLAAGPNLTASSEPYQVVQTAAHKFSAALPVQVVYENNAGVVVRHFSIDLFEQTYLTNADNAASVTSQPVPWRFSSLVPTGLLSFYDAGTLKPLGIRTPPRIPAVTPSTGAGALTLLKQYGYIWVIEQIDADGNTWRSPPSEALLLTLTGTQNTNTVTLSSWALDPTTYYRASLYRTAGNTSLYRRIYSTLFLPGPDIVYVDLLADTAQGAGEALYTTGEIENIITPPASMVTTALDRAWIVNREYPTELSYSKQLRPGRLPEFNDEMVHDLDDEFGGLTAIVGVDDKLLAFKESAVYTASGTGLDDAGAGQGYTITRIASDMGAITGSPVLGLGNEAYFVSKRGISRVRGDGACEFIGSPVDRYLNQPQLQTRETVRAIVYSKKWNEVRFVTNASVLVYSRTFEIWSRWVGGLAGSPLAHSLMIGDAQYIFREDGKVYVEGDTSQLTDGATAFVGYLRSQWMVPAQSEGRLRLYQARALAQRTAGGNPILPTMSVFFDYDDDTQIDFGPPSPLKATTSTEKPYMFSGKPHVRRQTCNAFSEQITFPAGDNTWRMERWGAVVGIKPGYSRNAQEWSE